MAGPKLNTSIASGGAGRFENTLWSRVFAAARLDSSLSCQPALEELCRQYWYPIYAYIRRCGRDRQQARDLTQGFFAYLLERDVLKRANPERGRFRSFLLGTLKNFLLNQHEKEQAIRRGGKVEFVSIDEETAEGLYLNEPSSTLTPEKLFDRRWAMTVLGEAMQRLRVEYERSGMKEIFTAAQPYLTGDGESSFAELGVQLKRNEGAARVLVFRFRERFRQLIRCVIADTVADLEQVELELEHLQAALRES